MANTAHTQVRSLNSHREIYRRGISDSEEKKKEKKDFCHGWERNGTAEIQICKPQAISSIRIWFTASIDGLNFPQRTHNGAHELVQFSFNLFDAR